MQHGTKRMHGKVGIPNPIVYKEVAVGWVYLVIVSAVIVAVFVDVDHSFVLPVKRGVEGPALGFGPTLDLNLIYHFGPFVLCIFLYPIKIPSGDFCSQICFGLFDADKRDGIFEFNFRGCVTAKLDPCALFGEGFVLFGSKYLKSSFPA